MSENQWVAWMLLGSVGLIWFLAHWGLAGEKSVENWTDFAISGVLVIFASFVIAWRWEPEVTFDLFLDVMIVMGAGINELAAMLGQRLGVILRKLT